MTFVDNQNINVLNPEQTKAVDCNLGNKLILAGAGSGKTRVLTYRVAKLIDNFDVKPSNILALTFTNKAANEMKQRIEELLKISTQGLWFGTFHGICRRFLKIHWNEAGISQFYTILDAQDQLRIIKRLLKRDNIDENLYDPKSIQSFINNQKDKGLRTGKSDNDKYNEIFLEYEDIRRQTNSLDFADLILTTYETLQKNSELLKYYTERFKHIMVDEFQDTNTLQFKLLKILNGKDGSLYAVGDDDQSIYTWRGARSENIQLFKKEFKNVEIFKLEQNYRSTEKILDVANTLISKNHERIGKNLWTKAGKGEPVYLYEAYNNDDESGFIAEKIKYFIKEGYKRSDIAILYRNNFLSRRLEEELNGRGIPYIIYGGFRFFERSEIKDVIGYLRLATNLSDDNAFERIINQPPRGIGEKTMGLVREFAKKNSISLWDAINNEEMIEGLSRLSKKFDDFRKMILDITEFIKKSNLQTIVEKTVKISGLITYFNQKKTEEALSKLENIDELISVADRFARNNSDSDNILDEFLDNAALEAGEYQSKSHEDPVQLMTIHSAKGLEFPIVFLTGLEESIFPNANRNDSKIFLEEERRLCYVAITRAMKILYITHANGRYLHGHFTHLYPSRFISEIPDTLLESVRTNTRSVSMKKNTKKPFFKIGQRVRHMKFGDGIILSYEGSDDNLKLQIKFEDYDGPKWLVLTYAHLDFL